MARPRWPERTGEARSPGQLTRFALALNGMRFSVHTGKKRGVDEQWQAWRTGSSSIPWKGRAQKPRRADAHAVSRRTVETRPYEHHTIIIRSLYSLRR